MSHKNTLKPTEANKLLVLHDKYLGFSNKQLSNKYNLSLNTIKDYLAVNGLWHKDYQEYKHEMYLTIVENAKNSLIKDVEKASRTLCRLCESKNENVALKASIEILNRCLGEKFEMRNNTGVDIIGKMLKEIEIVDD